MGELTSSKWNRRICSRSGKNDYKIDLISSMVAHHGFEEAKLWLKGVKENLARRPRAMIEHKSKLSMWDSAIFHQETAISWKDVGQQRTARVG